MCLGSTVTKQNVLKDNNTLDDRSTVIKVVLPGNLQNLGVTQIHVCFCTKKERHPSMTEWLTFIFYWFLLQFAWNGKRNWGAMLNVAAVAWIMMKLDKDINKFYWLSIDLLTSNVYREVKKVSVANISRHKLLVIPEGGCSSKRPEFTELGNSVFYCLWIQLLIGFFVSFCFKG